MHIFILSFFLIYYVIKEVTVRPPATSVIVIVQGNNRRRELINANISFMCFMIISLILSVKLYLFYVKKICRSHEKKTHIHKVISQSID